MADVLGKRISDLANNSSLGGAAVFPHTQGSSTMKVSLTDIANFILALVDQSKVDTAVASWLDQHPEATTTVEDGAITTPKLADGAVTSDKIANGTIAAADINPNLLDGICVRETAVGSVASFDDGGVSLPIRHANIAITPIQSGSGNPTPSNIRPLTGWTAANLGITGKNLFDEDSANWKSGYLIDTSGSESSNGSYKYSQNYTRVNPNTVYTVQANKGTSTSLAVSVPCYDENRNFISRTVVVSSTASTGVVYGSLTTPAGCKFIRLNVPKTDTTDIQVEEGSVPTAYEAFGDANVFSWENDAGTIYAGHYDPVTGILTAEYDILNIDGSKSVTKSGDNVFYYSLGAYGVSPNSHGENSTGWCSHYTLRTDVTGTTSLKNTSYSTCYNNSSLSATNGRAWFYDENYNDADDWKDYLISQNSNGTPVQYIFKLATPAQYQLTPNKLYTLDGVNNISANTGDIEVEYYANPKQYIAKRETATRLMITGIEAAYVATQNYTSGSLLIVGDTLYITTAAIASGGAITPGTNVTATTVADQLGGSLPSANGVSF